MVLFLNISQFHALTACKLSKGQPSAWRDYLLWRCISSHSSRWEKVELNFSSLPDNLKSIAGRVERHWGYAIEGTRREPLTTSVFKLYKTVICALGFIPGYIFYVWPGLGTASGLGYQALALAGCKVLSLPKKKPGLKLLKYITSIPKSWLSIANAG